MYKIKISVDSFKSYFIQNFNFSLFYALHTIAYFKQIIYFERKK